MNYWTKGKSSKEIDAEVRRVMAERGLDYRAAYDVVRLAPAEPRKAEPVATKATSGLRLVKPEATVEQKRAGVVKSIKDEAARWFAKARRERDSAAGMSAERWAEIVPTVCLSMASGVTSVSTGRELLLDLGAFLNQYHDKSVDTGNIHALADAITAKNVTDITRYVAAIQGDFMHSDNNTVKHAWVKKFLRQNGGAERFVGRFVRSNRSDEPKGAA